MSIQIYQIITILIYLTIAFCIWKVKNNKIRIFLILLMFLMFVANPIRFKQEGMSKIERRENNFNIELPEKVIVNTKSFNEQQTEEMERLKTQSKESVKNEIN